MIGLAVSSRPVSVSPVNPDASLGQSPPFLRFVCVDETLALQRDNIRARTLRVPLVLHQHLGRDFAGVVAKQPSHEFDEDALAVRSMAIEEPENLLADIARSGSTPSAAEETSHLLVGLHLHEELHEARAFRAGIVGYVASLADEHVR